MKKSSVTILCTKMLITVIVLIVFTAIMNYFNPAISSQLGVGQLEDSYTAKASLDMWNDFRNYYFLIYILVPVIIFFSDIVYIIRKK